MFLSLVPSSRCGRKDKVFTPIRSTCFNEIQLIAARRARACSPTDRAGCSYKFKFYESSFLVAPSWHPRGNARDILARMLRGCRACRAASPSSLPRDYLIGRPAICCGAYYIVLPVCLCVVSFSKFHEHDTHDLLRTSRQLASSSNTFEFLVIC